ncbi:MAG: hypothetical protein Q7R83_00760 [bacterium]|nr:hypothetical protein [bacterium]
MGNDRNGVHIKWKQLVQLYLDHEDDDTRLGMIHAVPFADCRDMSNDPGVGRVKGVEFLIRVGSETRPFPVSSPQPIASEKVRKEARKVLFGKLIKGWRDYFRESRLFGFYANYVTEFLAESPLHAAGLDREDRSWVHELLHACWERRNTIRIGEVGCVPGGVRAAQQLIGALVNTHAYDVLILKEITGAVPLLVAPLKELFGTPPSNREHLTYFLGQAIRTNVDGRDDLIEAAKTAIVLHHIQEHKLRTR